MLLYGVLRLPAVQKLMTNKLTSYLSETMNTVVSLKGIDVSIFDHVILEDFYLEDQQKDTLLFAQKLSVKMGDFNLQDEVVELSKIKLQKLHFNLKFDTASNMNLQFAIDAFSDSTAVDTTETPSDFNWKIKCKRIEVENSAISYFVQNDSALQEVKGFNYDDIKLSPLNIYASNFVFHKNIINIKIDSLNFADKSGFRLQKLSSDIMYSDTCIDVSNLALLTPNSNIYCTNFNMSYASTDDFGDLFNKVKFNIDVPDSTKISMIDGAFFEQTASIVPQKIILATKIKGTLNNLVDNELLVKYGEDTKLKTHFTVKDMSDMEKMYFNVELDTLQTSIADLGTIKSLDNPNKAMVELPDMLRDFGRIFYSGNIQGSVNDVKTSGNLISAVGDVRANINVLQRENGSMNINGNMRGNPMSVSKLLDDNSVGSFNIKDTLNINITQSGGINGVANGVITNIELLGYKYQKIKFDAVLSETKYSGRVDIDDPNIKALLLGDYITKDTIPEIAFDAKIKRINPYELKLYSDTFFTAKLSMNGKIKGTNPDKLIAKIDCKIDEIKNKQGAITDKELSFVSNYNAADSTHKIKLSSEILDADINGKLKISTIAQSSEQYFYTIIPSLSDSSTVIVENKDSLYAALNRENNFDFNITVKDLSGIDTMYMPGIKIESGTGLSGKFNLKPDNLNLQFYCPYINVSGTEIEEIILNGVNPDNKIELYTSIGKLFLTSNNAVKNSLFHTTLHDDRVDLKLIWNSFLDSLNYSGDFTVSALFDSYKTANPTIKLQLDSSNFAFADNKWIISSNVMQIDTSRVDLGNIIAKSSNNEVLKLSGIVSENESDTLKLFLDKIKLSSFNSFLTAYGVELEGTMYGKTDVAGVMGDLRINSSDSIVGLKLSGETVGDIRVRADWDNLHSLLNLYTETQLFRTKSMILRGKYNVEKDSLDMNLKVNRFPFNTIAPFVDEYITKIGGKISGNLSIKGSTEKPEINAGLKFIRAGFKINYLNTYYTFTDSLFIEKNMITLKRMQINAGRNSFAWLSGKVTHKNFENIKLNFYFEPHRFLFLNTQETDSSLFYGKVYASGGINIIGDPDNMDVNIKLKTERGTRFYLPLSSSSEVSENSYITFVKRDTTSHIVAEEPKVDLSGINIKCDLQATSDAEMQIIMDETVGDIMKVRGMGNLDLKVNKSGDIFLSGVYTVTKGDYLFTLQNVVNKKFEVQSGSTIRWFGDPYQANMDITAIYKIRKVSLFDLMVDENFREKKSNVECLLGMKGNLMNPNIDFGLEVSDVEEEVSSSLKRLDKNDLNQQILSLLILGKFRPLPGMSSSDASSGANPLANNAIEMMTNQLNNWLSKISDDFDIGINYKQGGELSSDEVEVALSTQLFNDRVSINTNVGMGTGSNSQRASRTEQESANKIVGDVEIEVKLNKKGSWRAKAFNKTNQRNAETSDKSLYTQGVGIFFRKEFRTVKDLAIDFWRAVTFKNVKKRKKLKKKKRSERRKRREEINKAILQEERDDKKTKN